MARRYRARGWVVACAIAVALAPGGAFAQDAREGVVPVEPPDPTSLLALCAEGADALWRGRARDAERLGRRAIEPYAPAALETAPQGSALRHAVARCEALIGRAILAGGSRDPAIVAMAAEALRHAWVLEPSADLVAPLVSSHWLGSRSITLLLPAHSPGQATPAERAAIGASTAGARARTLRTMPAVGGWTWSIVAVERARATDVRAVVCARSRCVAGDLFTITSDAGAGAATDARLASVGFVATRGGLALVVDADHTLAVEPGDTRSVASRRGATWSGSAVHVRWLDRGGLGGWSVLTRSRAGAWDRAAMGAPRPATTDVQVRWVARDRVILRSVSPSVRVSLQRALGARDPRALECGGCWLGGARPPALPSGS